VDLSEDDILREEFNALCRLYNRNSNEITAEQLRTHQQRFQIMVDRRYEEADVLLGTPESMHILVSRNARLNVSVIWIDEAFTMTEPEILIPLTIFPRATARFMTGDDKQCEPVVVSMHAHKTREDGKVFCAQFSPQLQLFWPFDL
jgi:hypothetical protein